MDMHQAHDTVTLTSCPDPFRLHRITEQVPEGWTVADMVLHAVPPACISLAHAWIDGDYVPRTHWLSVRPKRGRIVTVRTVPGKGGGGKNPLSTVLSLAMMVAAPGLGSALGGALGNALGFAQGGILWNPIGSLSWSSIGTGIVSIAGRLATNAIAPPSRPRVTGGVTSVAEKPTLFITGARNQALPLGRIPRPLGRHRMVPPLGAFPYTETAGSDQYLRMLFVWGYGPLEISDIRIGETPIGEFSGVDIETRQGYDDDEPLTLFTNDVSQNDISVTLTQSGGWQTRTTATDVDQISVDITFNSGLFELNSAGRRVSRTVAVEVEYSPAGAGTWTSVPGFTATASQQAALRLNTIFNVDRGQYDVRLRRTTTDSASDQIFDVVTWTALRSIRSVYPINMTGIAATALRIKATDQLNGVVDRFNGIVHSILPDWDADAEEWTERTTANPASIFRHVLQGRENARALADSRLDLTTLQAWHEDNAAAGREFNYVVDSDRSVRDILSDVAAAGRASPGLIDGKWTVVRDRLQTVPVQHFTPRNSFGFQGARPFDDLPHALKVRFINRNTGWLADERVVYDDGYNANNATKFEGVELIGVTDPDHVWKDGRYHIATARLRPEVFTFNADVEHIVCTRGDLIRFSHDVPLLGLGAARIKTVTLNEAETAILSVTVDDVFTMESGKTYNARIRTATGSSVLAAVNTVPGPGKTLTFSTPLSLGPDVGDLLMFGETGLESIELIVKSIEPMNDLTARLTCIAAAPGVHTSDTGTIPPFNSEITIPPDMRRPTPPTAARVQTGRDVVAVGADGSFSPTITVTLDKAPSEYSLAVKIKAQGDTVYGRAQHAVSGNTVIVTGVESEAFYDVEMTHINNAGMSSPALTLAGVYVEGLAGVPDDVTGLNVTIQGSTAQLVWTPVSDIDVSHYRIKWSSAAPDSATWASSIDLVVQVPATTTSKSVPALSGTYLVKAVDFGGRESSAAAKVSATIESLEGFNAISTLTEDPAFSGTADGTVSADGVLRLDAADSIDDWADVDALLNFDLGEDGIVSSGTYYFANSLDLTDVYTSRVTASLTVVGVNVIDNVDSWTDIDLVEDFDVDVDPSLFGVLLQVRTTNDDPGGSPTWSAWRDFVVGDYTARAFEFRVTLSSRDSSVTPEVSELSVTIDMPDRMEGEHGKTSLSSDSPSTIVTFPQAFKDVPAVAITSFDMTTGDYYTITNRTRTGFEIIFRNAAGTRVTRSFDYQAKGFGRT